MVGPALRLEAAINMTDHAQFDMRRHLTQNDRHLDHSHEGGPVCIVAVAFLLYALSAITAVWLIWRAWVWLHSMGDK